MTGKLLLNIFLYFAISWTFSQTEIVSKDDEPQAFSEKTENVAITMFNNTPVYEFNEVANFTGFRVDLLADGLVDHPLLCIKFSHFRNPNELESIGQERIIHFTEYLLSHDIPMNQIIFSDIIEVMDCELLSDCRARTYGVIYSMEGNCE